MPGLTKLTLRETQRVSRQKNRSVWISRSFIQEAPQRGDIVILDSQNGLILDEDKKNPLAYKIERIEKVDLGKILPQHAVVEGYSDVDAWKRNWSDIYKDNRATEPKTPVYRMLLQPGPRTE